MIMWFLVVYTTYAAGIGGSVIYGPIDCMPGLCKWEQKEVARIKVGDLPTCRILRDANPGSKCLAEVQD